MMGRLSEPDDVDIVVDGRGYDPESHKESAEFIKTLKSRPEHAEQVRQAMQTLESLGIDTSEFGKSDDPGGLLAQWRRNIEDYDRKKRQESASENRPAGEPVIDRAG